MSKFFITLLSPKNDISDKHDVNLQFLIRSRDIFPKGFAYSFKYLLHVVKHFLIKSQQNHGRTNEFYLGSQ